MNADAQLPSTIQNDGQDDGKNATEVWRRAGIRQSICWLDAQRSYPVGKSQCNDNPLFWLRTVLFDRPSFLLLLLLLSQSKMRKIPVADPDQSTNLTFNVMSTLSDSVE